MANKNRAANAYHYSQKKLDHLIRVIDKRAATGEDRENVDPTYRKHTFAANGERVWSY